MWKFLKKLLAPLARRALIALVQKGGDHLQGKLSDIIKKDGQRAVDRNFDLAQKKTLALIDSSPKWIHPSLRDGVNRIIRDEGDKFQAMLGKTVKAQGPVGADILFDLTQKAIIDKIGRIKL